MRVSINYELSTLIEIWGRSVKQTHTFLADGEIEYYKPLMKQGIDSGVVYVAKEYIDDSSVDDDLLSAASRVLGFIVLDDQKIDMLFVDPDHFRRGVGAMLIEYAIDMHDVNEVDVNEQNEGAVSFYKRMGFKIFKRFETDSEGKPYPILAMVFKQKSLKKGKSL